MAQAPVKTRTPVVDGSKITVRDIESYLSALGSNTGSRFSNTPYTLPSGTTLTRPQLAGAMKQLGYSKTQINQGLAGDTGGSGFLHKVGGALTGLAGGLAAMGPEASFPVAEAGDALATTGASALAPAAVAATETAGGISAGTAATIGAGGLFAASVGPIQSVTDFLQFIAWIFNPLNILRAVEGVIAVILLIGGGILVFKSSGGAQSAGGAVSGALRDVPVVGTAARAVRGVNPAATRPLPKSKRPPAGSGPSEYVPSRYDKY
jgi:hypothetical protein